MKAISSDVAFEMLNALQAEKGLLEVSLTSSSWSAGLNNASLSSVSRELVEFTSPSGSITLRWPESTAKFASPMSSIIRKKYSSFLSVEWPTGIKLAIGALVRHGASS